MVVCEQERDGSGEAVNESHEQAGLVCHSLLRTNGHSWRGSGRDLASIHAAVRRTTYRAF